MPKLPRISFELLDLLWGQDVEDLGLGSPDQDSEFDLDRMLGQWHVFVRKAPSSKMVGIVVLSAVRLSPVLKQLSD